MSGWISPYSAAQLAELEKEAREVRIAVEIGTTTPIRHCTGTDSISHSSNTYTPKAFRVRSMPVGGNVRISFEGPSGEMIATKFSEGTFGGLDLTLYQFLRQDDGSWLLVATRPFIIRYCTWNPREFVVYAKEETRVRRKMANSIVTAHCDLEFKGSLCQYAGADTRCLKTWDDCKSKANTQHFRGARYAPPPDYRLVIDFTEQVRVWVPDAIDFPELPVDPPPPDDPPPRRRRPRRRTPEPEPDPRMRRGRR